MKKLLKIALCLMAVVFCMTVFFVPAFASDGSAPAEEDAAGSGELTPETLESFSELLSSFTPSGNLTLIDDFELKGSDEEGKAQSKQFITVESKNGNTFFIIIDRVGDKENVYFLNMVDEADLMALIEEEEKEEEPPVCTCNDKCYAGHVDTSCPVCAVNMTECTGPEPEPEQTEDEGKPKETKGGTTIAGAAVLLILLLAGGGAYYFLKVKGKSKPDTKGETDLDDYDYGEDEDEMEFEPYGQEGELPSCGDEDDSEPEPPPDQIE